MKKITTLFLFFFAATIFGQKDNTADLYFNDFAYAKSAELYAKSVQKGDSTKHTLSRLADAYYLNSNTVDAEVWYAKLFENFKNEGISHLHYFRYAQSLKKNGKLEESKSIISEMNEVLKEDSRKNYLATRSDYFRKDSTSISEFDKVHNLSINSSYSDYAGYFNDSVIYFSSNKPKLNISRNKIEEWNSQPFYSIYTTDLIAFKDDLETQFVDGDLGKNVSELSSEYHDASSIITKDGKTIYFTRDNFNGKKLVSDDKNVAHLQIYKATLVGGKWSNIKELPFNNKNFSIGHPALSLDEKTLYFISDMPGGFGNTDIYKVSITGTDTYSKPVNLGPQINTEGKEMFPFVENDTILYFSSDGHNGLGELDIFKSEIENDTFGEVENLKAPINSAKDDFAFSINRKKSIGFFSSNRDGGKGDDDIYSFVISSQLEGVVTDLSSGDILPGAKVVLYLNDIKKDSLIVASDGKYQFNIAKNAAYKIEASRLLYINNSESFVSPKKNGITVQDITLQLKADFERDSKQIVINIDPIYFDFAKANIRDDAAIQLDKVVEIMNKYPDIIIKSSSLTDARGNYNYNLKLSARRAKATVKYIVAKGISTDRISGQGFGEAQLLNDCCNGAICTEEEHQLNRRTQFVVMNASGVISDVMPEPEFDGINHKIENGDTLFSIAKKHNTTVRKLKQLNNLKSDKILVGFYLKLK